MPDRSTACFRRKIPNETQEDFYARILQVMAQMGGGSANVL